MAEIDLLEFVGQVVIVQLLLEQIRGAKALGKLLQCILLLGNPGLGKTALARSIAHKMGVAIYEISGSRDFTPYALSCLAENFQPFEILFFDEIHATSRDMQLCLQRLITDGVVPKFEVDPVSRRLKQTGEKKIAPVTLIGATDRPGDLLKALRSRFGLKLLLTPYNTEEMRKIVRVIACRIPLTLTDDAIGIIGRISKGIPRIAEKHLDAIQNFAAANQITDLGATHAHAYLRSNGIDDIGLTDLDRSKIFKVPEGIPVYWGKTLRPCVHFVNRSDLFATRNRTGIAATRAPADRQPAFYHATGN